MRDRPNPRPLSGPAALLAAALLVFSVGGERQAQCQDAKPAARAAVPISFLPPPMENATYSLGIYDAKSGKLVRRLQEVAPESAFTVGDNGLFTSWDGKDDSGAIVPPGRYAARGYAVGSLKVEGTDILGNDWAAEDADLRITRVASLALVPADGGLVVLAMMAGKDAALLRFAADGKLVWRKPFAGVAPDEEPTLDVRDGYIYVLPRKAASDGVMVKSSGSYRVEDGSLDPERSMSEQTVIVPLKLLDLGVPVPPPKGDISTTVPDPDLSVRSGVTPSPSNPQRGTLPAAIHSRSPGKDGTFWSAAGLSGLLQTAPDGKLLRKLDVAPGDPLPIAVSASTREDRLYILEEKPGWQRVRGLSWVETKKEEDGKQVSTWQTFFERSIRPPDPALGLDSPQAPVEISLVENPLVPGKPQKARLSAGLDSKGSYLTSADGLRLRQISQRPNLKAVKLVKSKGANGLVLFEGDGAAWDEFSIDGARNMMEVDAGEFDMGAAGEKPVTEKAPEPTDL